MSIDHKALVDKYFQVWNAQDVNGISSMFSDAGSLRDWDVEVSGATQVGEANGKIFKAVPNIKIDVLTVHVSPSTNTAVAEILVNLNNDGKEVLKVTDVIEFDQAGLIKSLRAYKG